MRAFFVWHWWMEMGKKSLSHSIAPKLSQRGIFTLSPSSKFKCQAMVWLKASKSSVLPWGEVPASTKQTRAPWIEVYLLKSVNYCQRQQHFLSSDTLGGTVFCPLWKTQPESQPMSTSGRLMEVSTKRAHWSPWVSEMKCSNGTSVPGSTKWKTWFWWDIML